MIIKFKEVFKKDIIRYQNESRLLNIATNLSWLLGGGIIFTINALADINHVLAWLFWFRYLQFGKIPILRFIARIMYRRISRRYCIQIPIETQIGSGFYIGHGTGIIINGTAKIGQNCNISQFTTIGSNKGKAATIGYNVYIGPNVCIVEDVKIGNNVKIGAGTVVVHDVPDNATTVGNPNRIILKANGKQ